MNVSFDQRSFPFEIYQSAVPFPQHSYDFHVTSRASRSELSQEASLTTLVLSPPVTSTHCLCDNKDVETLLPGLVNISIMLIYLIFSSGLEAS